jgi:hypothetical protein
MKENMGTPMFMELLRLKTDQYVHVSEQKRFKLWRLIHLAHFFESPPGESPMAKRLEW